MADPQGRWQAFKDYSNTHERWLKNKKKRLEIGIEEDEIGSIEEAAFDVIRLRTIPDMPKVHVIMRDLPKYCRTKEGKKEIIKIAEEVEPVLAQKECFDEKGKPLGAEEIDAKWAARYRKPIIYRVKKASHRHQTKKEKETPLELLEAAYKKLTHEGMDLRLVSRGDYKKARKLAVAVKSRADEIEKDIYRLEKDFKALNRNGR
jgi:hypothetical protein